MIQPKVDGRLLPRQDFEGDDFTPGAGGHYVTCQDTAVGRMLAFATNGKVDLDGRVIRAAVQPPGPNGISLRQASDAIHQLSGRTLIIPPGLTWAQVLAHLQAHRGLVIDGLYDAIPRAHRFQANAHFGHAIWFSHYSPTSGMRTWDPLDADTTAYGRWLPVAEVRAFAESWGCIVGYIPLEPLPPATPKPPEITTGSHQTATV